MKKLLATLFTIGTLLPVCYSQTEIQGLVLSKEDNTPIAFASVGIKNKDAGCVADSSGKFILRLPAFIRSEDSLIISSIGFERSGLTVGTLRSKNEFRLKALGKALKPVVVKSSFKETTLGIKNESFLFFRAWQGKGTGGEIGQIIKVPSAPFTIRKVSIKIDNKYDTCFVRLRIRKIVKGEPAEDLIAENMIKLISQTTSNDNIDFEIPDNLIESADKKIFVGFEILDCHSSDSLNHSVCFVGNEYGVHIYKSHSNSDWEWYSQFGLYIKMSVAEVTGSPD